MVADALAYHPAVSHYLKFTATTAGRDKILRTIQYVSRFLAWYNLQTNRSPESIAPFEAIKRNFGQTRKILRFGKFIEHFRAAAHAADSKNMDPVLRYCAIGRQIGYGIYLSIDNYATLHTIGARKITNFARLQRDAARAWLAGIVFNIVAGIYTLSQLHQREALVSRKDGEGVVEGKNLQRERKAARTQLMSDLCDALLPMTTLGLANFDDGIIGLSGTISSLIGLSTVWKKTA